MLFNIYYEQQVPVNLISLNKLLYQGSDAYILTFFMTSVAIGTMELTGLVMMAKIALGLFLAMEMARSRTIDAFTLKRSSRVMPGLRGTPAGTTTRSASGEIQM